MTKKKNCQKRNIPIGYFLTRMEAPSPYERGVRLYRERWHAMRATAKALHKRRTALRALLLESPMDEALHDELLAVNQKIKAVQADWAVLRLAKDRLVEQEEKRWKDEIKRWRLTK